ncbi:MAG: MFS transporter [Butyrivibrio sp.]
MKHKKYICGLAVIVILIVIVQFADSYQSDLFTKLQSFFITEYFVEGKGMTFNASAGLLNGIMLPCYIISALAPLARTLADKFGKEKIIICNFIILTAGLFTCIAADNVIVFAVGNAVVTFGTSLDIQYLYIAEDIPEKRRGLVRGIAAAVGAAASMFLPVCRNYFVGRRGNNWRILYQIGILICLITIFMVMVGSFFSHRQSERPVKKQQNNDIKLKELITGNKKLLILLMIMGIATAGVTYYNEPLLTYNHCSEKFINTVLIIQPAVTFLLMLLIGAASDRIGRRKTTLSCIILTVASLIIYVISIKHFPNAVLAGICWGIMISAYFSVINLSNLTLMESNSGKNTGKLSAAGTYFYGFGDAAGMVLAVVLVRVWDMGVTKILLTIIPCTVALIYAVVSHRNRHPSEAS